METPVKNAVELVIEKLKKSGFIHVSGERWFNVELGVFPQSLVGGSFFVHLANGERFQHQNGLSLKLNIEFVFDTKNDNYLNKIDSYISAINSLPGKILSDSEKVLAAKIATIPASSGLPFSSVYLGEYIVFRSEMVLNIGL